MSSKMNTSSKTNIHLKRRQYINKHNANKSANPRIHALHKSMYSDIDCEMNNWIMENLKTDSISWTSDSFVQDIQINRPTKAKKIKKCIFMTCCWEFTEHKVLSCVCVNSCTK
jgi:hypothetical protein